MRMRPSAGALTAVVAAVVLALLPFDLSGYHQGLASKVALFFVAQRFFIQGIVITGVKG